MWDLEGDGGGAAGCFPRRGVLWGPAGALEGGFRKGLATSTYFRRAEPQHSPSRTGKRRGRDAREADQHFLTRTYPPRNREGAATVPQYWKPASVLYPPSRVRSRFP